MPPVHDPLTFAPAHPLQPRATCSAFDPEGPIFMAVQTLPFSPPLMVQIPPTGAIACPASYRPVAKADGDDDAACIIEAFLGNLEFGGPAADEDIAAAPHVVQSTLARSHADKESPGESLPAHDQPPLHVTTASTEAARDAHQGGQQQPLQKSKKVTPLLPTLDNPAAIKLAADDNAPGAAKDSPNPAFDTAFQNAVDGDAHPALDHGAAGDPLRSPAKSLATADHAAIQIFLRNVLPAADADPPTILAADDANAVSTRPAAAHATNPAEDAVANPADEGDVAHPSAKDAAVLTIATQNYAASPAACADEDAAAADGGADLKPLQQPTTISADKAAAICDTVLQSKHAAANIGATLKAANAHHAHQHASCATSAAKKTPSTGADATTSPTVDAAATPCNPLCAPTPSSPVASLCHLKLGPQALAECHSAGTNEDPLGVCFPQARHESGDLKPVISKLDTLDAYTVLPLSLEHGQFSHLPFESLFHTDVQVADPTVMHPFPATFNNGAISLLLRAAILQGVLHTPTLYPISWSSTTFDPGGHADLPPLSLVGAPNSLYNLLYCQCPLSSPSTQTSRVAFMLPSHLRGRICHVQAHESINACLHHIACIS
ncbi:hypothetical protein L7F22_010309 [Adiantum nelumboides]|nr:hypothetical protein [Adiantum nelumboides]